MTFSLETTVPIVDYPSSYGYITRLVYISPREFFRLAQLTSTNSQSLNMPLESYMKTTTYEPSIKKAMVGLKSKKAVVPIGYIEFKNGFASEHEGRNRAEASRRLGLKKIPVKFLWKKGTKAPPQDTKKIKPYFTNL